MNSEVSRILVVDDNLELAENLAEILEFEGVDSRVAANGRDALALLQEMEFNLVLTDIRMPGMNGVELLRKIHAHWPALPVVAMSAYSSDSTLDDAVSAGALDVLFKPVNCDLLIGLVHRLAEPEAPVLLIEDDRGLRVTLTEILLYETDVVPFPAGNLATARRLVDAVEFRVAVVDVKLPDGDGMAFGKELVERFGDRMTVLIITAFPNELSDPKGNSPERTSTLSILEKPFAPSRLISLLKVLGN